LKSRHQAIIANTGAPASHRWHCLSGRRYVKIDSMRRQYLVPAAKRALEVIELLSKENSGLSLSEIHRSLRLPLSSAANIVYTLQTLGYLERNAENSHYHLSLKMLGISRRVLDYMDIPGRCHSLLEDLVRESGLTGHLAVLRDGESIYIDRAASDGLVQFSTYVGMRWPAYCSAAGKALLAFLGDAELHNTLRHLSLHRFTPRTITSRRVLENQLRSFRRLGYTWEMEEGEGGVACVAAPIFGQQDQLVAAVSVSGTIQQIPKKRVKDIGAMVRRYAQMMSSRLGTGSIMTNGSP
jgi:DNA-binding IclR family transcriptional regulator